MKPWVQPLRIFVGYDSRETAAYHVLCHSILRHASGPVSFTPIVQDQLRRVGLYTRERGPLESTEFSLTRFLTPFLAGNKGWALFLDCDMLCRGDVFELLHHAESFTGDQVPYVWCVKHDYMPSRNIKMDGQIQSVYPRKNWSSLMLFQSYACRMLTPDFVNTAIPGALHQFGWLRDRKIGSLPAEWNMLVGEPNQTSEDPKMIHYTQGGPWFRDYQHCDYAQEWFDELDLAFPSMNVLKPLEVSHG
jgi:hypothetical protein